MEILTEEAYYREKAKLDEDIDNMIWALNNNEAFGSMTHLDRLMSARERLIWIWQEQAGNI